MKTICAAVLVTALLLIGGTAFAQTKVTFWYGLTGVNGTIVQQVVDRYNASQNRYVVEAVSQPDYDATINKLNTSLAGGELPNVVQVYDVGTQRMIDTKRVTPVGDLVARDKLDLIGDLEPAVASYYTLGGKLWSMPFNSSAPVMYYNVAAFREAGLPTNKTIWTYDELRAALKKLTKKDGSLTRTGLGFTVYSWILEEELAIQGTVFAEPNNGRTGRATKLVFNNPEAAKWLDFLKTLVQDGTARSFGVDGGANSAARDAAFVNGESAVTFNSIAGLRGYLNGAADAGKGVEVGTAYLPRPQGAQGGVIIGGASLWITNTGSAEEQAGAWDFVKFTSRPEIQAFFSSNTGYYPTRKAAYKEPEMKAALAQFPQFQVAVDELRSTRPSVATQGAAFGTFVNARGNIQAAMEQFLSGKFPTAQAALDDAARKSGAALSEYNALVP